MTFGLHGILMQISDAAILIACLAFLITQVHLVRVARKLKRASEASWAKAEATIASSRESIKDDVVREIQGIQITLPDELASLPPMVSSIPQSVGEVMSSRLEDGLKDLGNHFSQNLEAAVNNIKQQVAGVEERFLAGRRFGGDPKEAQAKGVESRKVNQIVDTLEAQVMGPSIAAKVNELAQFLVEVGQADLADWLDENHQAITAIERRIRANPALAARLQQYQQKLHGGGGGQPRGGML